MIVASNVGASTLGEEVRDILTALEADEVIGRRLLLLKK